MAFHKYTNLKAEIAKRMESVNEVQLQEDINNILLKPEQRAKAKESFAQLLADRRKLRELKLKIAMCKSSLEYKGPLAPESYSEAVGNARPEAGELSQLAAMPQLVPPVTGITLAIRSGLSQLPEEVTAYLINQVEAFQSKGISLDNLTVLAPEEAVSEEGAVLPLPTIALGGDKFSVEKALVLFSKRELPKEFYLPLSWRAWQWLIISHNQVFKTKVHLKNSLRSDWADPLNKKRKKEGIHRSQELAKLKVIIERQASRITELEKALTDNLSVGNRSPSTKETTKVVLDLSAKMKEDMIETSSILEGETGESPVDPRIKGADAEEQEPEVDDSSIPIPLTLSWKGRKMMDFDISNPDFWMDRENSVSEVAIIHHQGQWCAFVSEPTGVSYQPESEEILQLQVSSSHESRVKKKKPAAKTPKGTMKPLTGEIPENPAKIVGVPGVPRSSRLSDYQRESLRRFFNLKKPMDPADWEALSLKEKRAARKAMAIPRWAVTAVLQDPRNLDKVVKGTLKKGQSNTPKPSVKRRGRSLGPSGRSSRRNDGSRTRISRRRNSSVPTGHELIGKLVSRLLAL
jgi:hypothetical protein